MIPEGGMDLEYVDPNLRNLVSEVIASFSSWAVLVSLG